MGVAQADIAFALDLLSNLGDLTSRKNVWRHVSISS